MFDRQVVLNELSESDRVLAEASFLYFGVQLVGKFPSFSLGGGSSHFHDRLSAVLRNPDLIHPLASFRILPNRASWCLH